MKIQPDDYVLHQERQGESSKLVSTVLKVISVKGEYVKGLIENMPHLNPVKVEVEASNIKLNFGQNPPKGVAFGVDFEARYLGAKHHDDFGDIHFFTKPSKEAGKALFEGMTKAAKRLDKAGLKGVLDLPVAFEVRKTSSKMIGWFKRSKDPDLLPHRIAYSPAVADDSAQLQQLLLHELGHLVDRHILSKHKEHWAKWIKLYSTSVEPISLSIQDSKQLRKDLFQAVSEEMTLRQWMSSLEVEERRKANLVVAWIRKVHSINSEELDCLLGSQEQERVHDLWPLDVLSVKGTVPLVTEYATKSVAELFAESFCLYLVGKELPKSVNKLIEKSISLAKSELN